MTIAVRGVVELFRNVRRAMEVQRNILGFSILHDDKTVRIYGHYAEIDGDSPPSKSSATATTTAKKDGFRTGSRAICMNSSSLLILNESKAQ